MNRLFRRGVGFVFRPLQFLVYLLGGLVPREADRWAFGTWSGTRFADNSATVFRYLNEVSEPGVRTAWITRRREIRDELRRQGLTAYTAWSPGGVWWALRSGVHVYDSTPYDVNYWLSRNARCALLMHGTGMKKIERAIDAEDHRLYKLFHGRFHEKLVWRLALPWHLRVPDIVAVCSRDHAQQAVAFFGIDIGAARITGLPRHDRLPRTDGIARSEIPTVGAGIPADRPVFLYLPTFREGMARQSFDWSTLHAAAEAAGVTIAVKLHVIDAERGILGTNDIADSDHLRMVDPTIDPIDVYGRADGLITDFSSVAYDLLLLDRPVIHYVPDLDDFLEHRPLIAPFEDLTVGPICNDLESLSAALISAADPADTATVERRREIRERCFTHPPGGASARVVDEIRSLFG